MLTNRRQVLKGAASIATAAAMPAIIGGARAQAPVTLQWWVASLPKEQRAAYEYQIKTFEDANPGVKVNVQQAPDEQQSMMLSAAFASKQVPNVISNIPAQVVLTYANAGLLLPMNYLIDEIGADKFLPDVHKSYETQPGSYAATCYVNVPSDMLWIRTDLMEKAGVAEIPKTWDQLRAACQKMQKGGVYGAPFPYAANSMTTAIFLGMVHRGGGQIFTPDLEVAIQSDEVLHTLDFYSSMRELCPPGATSYTWQDSLKVFVAGACATAIYSGRVLHDIHEGNPAIRDHFACTLYPTISKDVLPWTFNTFAGLAIPKDAPNLEMTKKFAVHLYRHDGYLKQTLADPGHNFPVLKSIDADPEYNENPLIKKYHDAVEVMTNAGGFNLSQESAKHKRNLKGGEVTASGILGEIVQRVCLNKENAKAVLADAAKRIEQIVKS